MTAQKIFSPLIGLNTATITNLRHLLLAVHLSLFVTPSAFSQPEPVAIAPTITLQPSGQAAEHGGNIRFTVGASGTSLRYQWQKNGTALVDLGNVGGAQSAELKLVGVAQSDAADYAVVVYNTSGAVTSVVAALTVGSATIFNEDFESGDLKNWTAFSELAGLSKARQQRAKSNKLASISMVGMSPEAGGLMSSAMQNITPGGARSAALNDSRGKMYHNLGGELAGRVKATFWIYDNGHQARCFGELRGYTGSGHALYNTPGGMKQLLAIGRYAISFGANNGTGVLAGEKVDSNKYQGKIERGRNTGWFNLSDAADRSVGWHKFEIEREANGTTIHFFVDGQLGRTVTDADHVLLDCVTIGSVGAGAGVGDAWFDDVKVEAWPWRFDWQSKDSTGKGLFDWMKLRETGEDPQVSDITQITTVSESAGATTNSAVGYWTKEGAGVYACDMRGSVTYVVNAPADDAYRIEVEGRERTGKSPTVKLPLRISIDGEYLGRFTLPYNSLTNGVVHCFTPFLKAGPHVVEVQWDNAEKKCALYLQAVRLQTLAGADANQNGVKDWVENRLFMQSGVEFAPRASRVSPVCMEGRGQYLSMMECRAGVLPTETRSVPIRHGAGNRWYADVPLSLDITTIETSFQNGVLKETHEVLWEETNLLEAEDQVIRRGDSLLLTAVPTNTLDGTVNIAVIGITNYTTDAATPIVHQFDHAGTFKVMGAFAGRTEAARVITVKVVAASFENSPVAWVGKRRFWDCTNLPPEAVIDADPRLKIDLVSDTERQSQKPVRPPLGANGRQYSVTTDAAEPRYVLGRLGLNGPVLASAVTEGFRLFSGNDTYLRFVHVYPDKSQLVEEAFILSPVPRNSNLRVQINLIVSGVTFEDGTLTKILTPPDFDPLGICRVRYVRAAGVKTSVCHTTKVYQDGELIGWPGYEP